MALLFFLLTALSLLLWGGIHAFVWVGWLASPPSRMLESILFLSVATFILTFSVYKRNGLFTSKYLVSIVLKLLVYPAFPVYLVLIDHGDIRANVFFFLGAYLLFTGIGVGWLYSQGAVWGEGARKS